MAEAEQKPGRFLLRLTLKLHQSPPVKTSPSIFVFTFDAPFEPFWVCQIISAAFMHFFHDAIIDNMTGTGSSAIQQLHT